MLGLGKKRPKLDYSPLLTCLKVNQSKGNTLEFGNIVDMKISTCVPGELISEKSKSLFVFGAAVAQEIERVVHYSEDWWFDPRLFRSACQSVPGQDTEPQIATEGCVSECVCE